MKKATFLFQCRLTTPASFSAYKGSMLRGSLGTFLKKTCCTVRRNSCDDCMLAQNCAFPLLFIGKPTEGGGQPATLPPPYCIEPCDTGKTAYEAGESFSFSLTLFSYAVGYLPYFVHAFILAGQNGMGKTLEDGRGSFVLEDILHNGRSIFHKENQKLDIPEGEELPLPQWNTVSAGTGTLLVHLRTPCRFKSDNRLAALWRSGNRGDAGLSIAFVGANESASGTKKRLSFQSTGNLFCAPAMDRRVPILEMRFV